MKKTIRSVKNFWGRKKKRTAQEIANDQRKYSKSIRKKSEELKSFAKAAPSVIRIMEANADLIDYNADELDKFYNFNNQPLDFQGYEVKDDFDMQFLIGLGVPTQMQLYTVGTSVSGLASDSTGSMASIIEIYSNYQTNYYDNIPRSFVHLNTTADLTALLNTLRHDYSDTWNEAREQLMLVKNDSLKNSAVNARTVVDELSWLTDYEHLKTLKWCELDSEDKPIRAVRYAWILHGDKLPQKLKGDPKEDAIWRTLQSGYSKLGKYVHKSGFKPKDKLLIETSLNSIETALISYLKIGMDRLKLRIDELNNKNT